MCVPGKRAFNIRKAGRKKKKTHMEDEVEERCQDDSWAVDLTSHLSRLEQSRRIWKRFLPKESWTEYLHMRASPVLRW